MARDNGPTNDPSARRTRDPARTWGAGSVGVTLSLIGLVVIAFALPPQGLLGTAQAASQDALVRDLPERAMCGETIQVTLTVNPPDGTEAWLVDEAVPPGTTVTDVDPSNNGELIDDHVKWVSTTGDAAVLTYNVTIPDATADGTQLAFNGTYRFHESMTSRATIAGDDTLTVTCGSVERTLPASVECGATFEVTLTVDAPDTAEAWLIDEVPPPGANITDVDPSHNGALVDGHVKWVSTSGANAVVTYNVTVPANLANGAVLAFDGTQRLFPAMDERGPVTGDDTVTVACLADASTDVHPFDTNGDCVFSESELFSLIDQWKATTADEPPTDAQLFEGIRHWKQLPGPYCIRGG